MPRSQTMVRITANIYGTVYTRARSATTLPMWTHLWHSTHWLASLFDSVAGSVAEELER